MFTGIVETKTPVVKKTNTQLVIKRPKIYKNLRKGQSVAVNGACLSVMHFDDETMQFDVMPETFKKTNLGETKIVNVERAMPADGRFEGHVVQGHVDGVLKLIDKKQEGDGIRFYFEKPAEYDKYFVSKGSVSINGVSLTIATDNSDIFEIATIPHTLEITNFGDMEVGDKVNFECDIMAKYLEKWAKN